VLANRQQSCVVNLSDNPGRPQVNRSVLQDPTPRDSVSLDAALGLISPVFADLSGLPPLIIQAGTHEVLLDDAVRLGRQAATGASRRCRTRHRSAKHP